MDWLRFYWNLNVQLYSLWFGVLYQKANKNIFLEFALFYVIKTKLT